MNNIEELNKLIESSKILVNIIDVNDYDRIIEDSRELIKGEYYYVYDTNNSFFMIGIMGDVEENDPNRSINNKAQIVSLDNLKGDPTLNVGYGWCFRSKRSNGSYSRVIKLATPEEKDWLDACIKAKKFISKMKFNRKKRI